MLADDEEGDAEDDEEGEVDEDGGDLEETLSEGANSIAWLPTVTADQIDSEIILLFTPGVILYTPSSEHIVDIFEPYHREMHTDRYLVNVTKNSVVSTSQPTESVCFGQIGVLVLLSVEQHRYILML